MTTIAGRLTLLSMALDDRGHRFDNVVDIIVCEARAQWQRDHAHVLAIGDRVVLWLVAVLVAVEGLQMDRNEVDARADVQRPELLDESCAVDVQHLEIEAE